MDEDTSTAQDVQPAEVVDSPAEAVQTDATDVADVAEPSEASQDSAEETPAAPDVDDKLRKYAANQGIELDSPGAIKAAKLAMKNQADKTREFQKASELEKATTDIADQDATITANNTGQDPEVLKRLQRMEVKETLRDFWSDPDHDRGMETKMTEIVLQKPYLAGDIEALYASAVYQSGGVAAVKSQAKKDTLSELAHKQQAAVPTGNATQRGTPKEKPFAELSIPEMEKRLGTFRT